VYRVRHDTVVAPSTRPAVTYLFREPIPPHEADGWYRTALFSTSHEEGTEPHKYWQLRRKVQHTPGIKNVHGNVSDASGPTHRRA
jgi:hypothetical protein